MDIRNNKLWYSQFKPKNIIGPKQIFKMPIPATTEILPHGKLVISLDLEIYWCMYIYIPFTIIIIIIIKISPLHMALEFGISPEFG